jgi:DNA repair protein RadD
MGLGCLTNGNIFTDVAYDLCTIEGFNRLIAEGYLVPPIPKRTETQLDVSNVKISNGEFAPGELQTAVDKNDITFSALKEVVNEGVNRKSWLVFASGVDHAEHIAEMLNTAFGVPTVCIHSKKTNAENAESLQAWKAGNVRAAVNMNALTTGVDHPGLDMIAMLRPTMSTGLWVQMLGRGTRPSPGKTNCLVLDFAGNTRRLGPINDPVIPKLKGQGPPGDAPVRICPACQTYNHASARFCVVCGEEFTFQEKLSARASEAALIRSDLPQVETLDVARMVIAPHVSKKSGLSSIKVAYYTTGVVGRTFYEYISVESLSKFFKHKSRDWFRQRYHYNNGNLTWGDDVPATNAEILALADELRAPIKIRVWLNRQVPEILGYEF